MAARRRSKKTTPTKELVSLLAIIIGFFVVTFRLDLSTNNSVALLGLILLIALFAGITLYIFFLQKQRAKQRALRAIELAHVDEMTGGEFEKYVAALLNSRGYKTKMTPPSSDYGVDIIATKDGVKAAVQVKRYTSKLDQKSIREAIAGKSVRKYGCTEAMVVTNSTFTKAAKFLANEGRCKLIDRDILGEWILGFQSRG